jgi:hypothetical protein
MKRSVYALLDVCSRTVRFMMLFLAVMNVLLIAEYSYGKTFSKSAPARYKPLLKKRFLPVNVVPPPLLRLKLINSTSSSDDIAIGFSALASVLYNPNEDSEYFPGSGPVGFSSLSADNVNLSVNLVPLPAAETRIVIRLDVETQSSGAFSLLRSQLDTIPDKYHLWLVDKLTKDSVDLRNTASYAFNINKTDTTTFGSNRFQVVVSTCMDMDTIPKAELLKFSAVKSNDTAQLVWTSANELNTSNFIVERSTDGGKTFSAVYCVNSNSSGSYSFADKNPVVGNDSYIIKLTDVNDTVSYSNMITIAFPGAVSPVLSAPVTKNSINIYPNPSGGIINLSITQSDVTSANGNSTTFDIMIMNSSGTIVKTAVSTQASWQDNVNNLVPGTYFVNVVRDDDKSLVGKSKFIKL